MAAPVSFRERSDSFPLHRGRRPLLAQLSAGWWQVLSSPPSFDRRTRQRAPDGQARRRAQLRTCCRSICWRRLHNVLNPAAYALILDQSQEVAVARFAADFLDRTTVASILSSAPRNNFSTAYLIAQRGS